MKRGVLLIGLVLSIMAMSFETQAQAKFGYINSLELLSLMPGVKTADAQLAKMQEEYGAKIQSYQTTYQEKYVEIQKNADQLSEVTLEAELKDLADLENRIVQFQQTAQQALATEREKLFAPILERANNTVQEVAKSNGFSYIFDAAPGSGLLYAPEGENILPLVKAKLGL